ncbi:MAG: FAD-dependent oxidoreductase [Deltaproteobacteria bacterium]|nr:FAD-dependent oxidoreductase [Deltaproteobacteria bacterium]
MTQPPAPGVPPSSSRERPPALQLGVPGFDFEDLYRPHKLAQLHALFLREVSQLDPTLHASWDAYRQKGPGSLPALEESKLLVALAPHVGRFVARLFGVEAEAQANQLAMTGQRPLFDFKRDFVQRRVLKKGAPNRPTADEFPALDADARLLLELAFPGMHQEPDAELALARAVNALLEVDKQYASGAPTPESTPARLWADVEARLKSDTRAQRQLAKLLEGADAHARVSAALSLLDRWTFARMLHPEGKKQLAGWVSHQQPKSLDFAQLVEMQNPEPAMPEAHEGPHHHLRRRDGFKLTDRRYPLRQVANEVDYCLYCHERGKDSCSTGMKQKDGSFKADPLGTPLGGCPLGERISEAHLLKSHGEGLGALAMVVLDNPMCAGTGHRICNDCMKACIFQKQEPVNIPQIETRILTDVLNLPWGFEIYGFLQRWNPLDVARPHARAYNGKNVLVVGLGPAGYTLAHHLLNDGFGVVAIDGLKIEPMPEKLAGRNGQGFAPIFDFQREVAQELDERVLAGFGGVSEYGITVRWDKNFLTLLHLQLARRDKLRIYGGVRLGGTLTLDDAWELGFHHVALAAGAGKPTLVGMKNGLIRGVRQASDFLMALQLTGAFKKDSLANLQVQLPAVVIGGGLTAIDTATELFAYYPVQVEKALERYERIAAEAGEAGFWSKLDPEELPAMKTFLDHGRAVRAERERAKAAGELPDFVPLVRKWGGVSLVYRKGIHDSPAYKLNPEEVTKSLEEGIRYIEKLSPIEAVPGPTGAVSAIVFEKQAKNEDGRWKGSGEKVTLPARTVCVAAGTSPNVTYTREHPNTFALDENDEYFRAHDAVRGEDGRFTLQPVAIGDAPKSPTGFFTNYARDGRFVTFYGDNHPSYFGNVVKAMASAKDGYPHVTKLFQAEIDRLDPAQQPARDEAFTAFAAGLDDGLLATVKEVIRLTPTIVEVVVRAPFAARHFRPGQFYRLQNYEANAPEVEGTRLAMEGLALTGAWTDPARGLLSTIVLEMGGSSRLCAALTPGEPVVLMGPTGAPTEIPHGQTVLLAGGGLGNAVLFSIGRALRAAGCRVLYFAGFRKREDLYHADDIEAATDLVVWSTDSGPEVQPRRPQDLSFSGNIVQAMIAYGEGKLGAPKIALSDVDRIIAIGSDRMMKAVKDARHGVLAGLLKRDHVALGSINSPMQCMMKEICAQCLQRHVDPRTGKETFVFSCTNQDQELDVVDFAYLGQRLRANDALEKLANLWLDHLLRRRNMLRV